LAWNCPYTSRRLITQTRKTFDAALLSLPITQHQRIWPLYLAFIKSHDIPETTVRVYRRHLKLDNDCAEDYIEYLISIGRLDDAAIKLADVVNSEKFKSKKGRLTLPRLLSLSLSYAHLHWAFLICRDG
jgi:pre-mRNA-splicing factor SYF1